MIDIRGGASEFFARMKHIIAITSLLAAGTFFANAKSLDYSEYSEAQRNGLLAAWSFSASASPDINTIGFGDSSGFGYDASGFGTISSSTGTPWKTNATEFADGNFTISLDVNYIGVKNWETLLDLSSSGSNGDAGTVQLGMNNDTGELMLFNGVGGEATYGGVQSGGNLGTGLYYDTTLDWATVTIVSNAAENRLSLYVNGVETGSWSGDAWTAGEGSSLALKGIQIGAVLGGGRKINDVQIDNIAFWNTAFSASDVNALIVVPEPSAFGLLAGLGALALAGTRRRRKQA